MFYWFMVFVSVLQSQEIHVSYFCKINAIGIGPFYDSHFNMGINTGVMDSIHYGPVLFMCHT